MYKSVTVAVWAGEGKSNESFEEHIFPELNKLLNSGYAIVAVHQIAPNTPTNTTVYITYVLRN